MPGPWAATHKYSQTSECYTAGCRVVRACPPLHHLATHSSLWEDAAAALGLCAWCATEGARICEGEGSAARLKRLSLQRMWERKRGEKGDPTSLQLNLHKSKSFIEICVLCLCNTTTSRIGKVLPPVDNISCFLGTASLYPVSEKTWVWPELGWKPSRIWDIGKDRHLETQVQCESVDIAFYTRLLLWESSWLLRSLGEGSGDMEILWIRDGSSLDRLAPVLGQNCPVRTMWQWRPLRSSAQGYLFPLTVLRD